jgi:Asp-tRNA(Asn)/Glu-tRNA(Gln) amidotransferase A subunit family amidase
LKINPRGIPFTVKDHLKVEDMIETCGYSDKISPAYESSVVVKLLEK